MLLIFCDVFHMTDVYVRRLSECPVCDEREIINMDTYLFSEETGIFPAAWLSPGGFLHVQLFHVIVFFF